MKHFELIKEYKYPSGSVSVSYNKEKDWDIIVMQKRCHN